MNTEAGSFEIRASAPGKIIILGEHFVVHGSLAVAAAINKRAFVTVRRATNDGRIMAGSSQSKLGEGDGSFAAVKAVANGAMEMLGIRNSPIDIEVESELPAGSGLGSSASVSVATAAAILKFFGESPNETRVSELACLGERAVHGNPSGIDVATCLHGGTLTFSKQKGHTKIVPHREILFLIAFSNVARNTSKLIEKVSQHRKDFPLLFEKLSRSISSVSALGCRAIERGDSVELGTLLNLTQVALAWIGVSSDEIEKLIERIFSDGNCYGAKLTGAGGGGSVIALPELSGAQKIVLEVSKQYPFTFLSDISEEGLKFHE